MARTVSLLLSAQHSADLQGVIEDRGRPVKHVQRAQIILLSAERLPVLEIAKRVGVSRPMVWRWQQRFAEEGIEGLLRDKTRPPGIPPVPQAKVLRKQILRRTRDPERLRLFSPRRKSMRFRLIMRRKRISPSSVYASPHVSAAIPRLRAPPPHSYDMCCCSFRSLHPFNTYHPASTTSHNAYHPHAPR